MTTYKIDANIPIPSKHQPAKYPIRDLEVGESFFVGGIKHMQISGSVSLARKKFPDRKFVTRACVEDGIKGIRIWRVDPNAPASISIEL